MSTPDIVKLLDNSKELDRVRKEQEEILLEINKMHKKLQNNWSAQELNAPPAIVSGDDQ